MYVYIYIEGVSLLKGKTTMKHRTHATKWAYVGRDSDQVVNKHEPIPMQVMVGKDQQGKELPFSSASNCCALSKKKTCQVHKLPSGELTFCYGKIHHF